MKNIYVSSYLGFDTFYFLLSEEIHDIWNTSAYGRQGMFNEVTSNRCGLLSIYTLSKLQNVSSHWQAFVVVLKLVKCL